MKENDFLTGLKWGLLFCLPFWGIVIILVLAIR